MVENRWQIAIGVIILELVVLAAVFSLGIYIGRHGFTREGLTLQPGGQGIQPPGGMPGAANGLPQPDVLGNVRSASPSGLELATRDGPRSVIINDETRFEDAGGEMIRLGDLGPGDRVAVFGQLVGGGERRMVALRVVRLPGLPREPAENPSPGSQAPGPP